MTDTDRPSPGVADVDDVEGSGYRMRTDGERDETDDTQGHGFKMRADGERDGTDDDVERHERGRN